MERKTVLEKTRKTTKHIQKTKEYERIYRQTNSREDQQLQDWLLPILTHESYHNRGSICTRQTRKCCFATHYFLHVVQPFLVLPVRHSGTLDPAETCNSIRLFFVSAKNQTDPFSHFLLAMLMEKC